MTNALTSIIADAKDAARHDLAENGEHGRSFPIRLRSGKTLTYSAKHGPRGGVTIRRLVVGGWISDHPADWDPRASY